MRQSSFAGNRTTTPSAVGLARLTEKKKEFDAVCALEQASQLFVQRFDGISDNLDEMAAASEGGYH